MIEPFTHVCTWPDSENEEFLIQVLQEMRENDVIQIIPKAYYRAWRNFVLEAEITITGESKESQLEEMGGKKIDGSIPSPLTPTVEDFYVPLNQSRSEIRVLRLLPGHFSTKISCMLWHIQLECEYPSQFEALSYCWGNPKYKKMIQLAGRDVQVTLNLIDALHRLRSDDGVTQNLWVDALCINQKDLEERSWQVQMMERVYAAASRVIVWLGEPSLNFHAAEVGRLLKVFDEEKDTVIDDCTTESLDLECLSQEELKNTVPKYMGVRVFFENVWFSRIWVLQEVSNARRILVRCGDRAFSWSLVLKINENVRRTLSEPAPQYHKAIPPLFSGLFALTKPTQVLNDDMSSTIPTRFGFTPRAPTENILDLMVTGVILEATDPRDKLFALLDFIEPKYHHLDVLQPNYEKDVAIVYRDFTRS
ncbi:hypothetical protein BTUL_0058g00520 [Botrytis tulipae]|uniref:Heterokaryon incompatibility domain-containing protein n=1 Tax=Botrytis tulipae TaxID=87230 RepID=A0A4Z1EZ62_9HELO|nr:hypothetical protein BTUL_0058g00520 [Botrytis tulipae]